MRWDYDGRSGMMDGGATGWVMVVVMVLLVVAVLGGLVFVLRQLGQAQARSAEAPLAGGRARQILDERFARGEIDRDEYASLRAALE